MDTKQSILLVCLIGIVGSAALLANEAFNGSVAAMVAAAIGSGMFVLFIAMTAELMVLNINHAISDKKQQENDELLAVVISKAIFQALKEEKNKDGK